MFFGALGKNVGYSGLTKLPVLDTVRDRLAAAERAGWGEEDFAALIKLLE